MLLCGHVQTLPLRYHKWLASSLTRAGVYHWDLAKNILRHLKGTRARGLAFSPGAHGDTSVVRGYTRGC